MRIGNAAKITVVLGLLAGGGQTRADELRVLSAASMQAVFKEIIDHLRKFDPDLSLLPFGICRKRAQPNVSLDGPIYFIDELL